MERRKNKRKKNGGKIFSKIETTWPPKKIGAFLSLGCGFHRTFLNVHEHLPLLASIFLTHLSSFIFFSSFFFFLLLLFHNLLLWKVHYARQLVTEKKRI